MGQNPGSGSKFYEFGSTALSKKTEKRYVGFMYCTIGTAVSSQPDALPKSPPRTPSLVVKVCLRYLQSRIRLGCGVSAGRGRAVHPCSSSGGRTGPWGTDPSRKTPRLKMMSKKKKKFTSVMRSHGKTY